MGRPKALLTLDGETFVSHLAGLLRGSGCVSVAVVMGAHADEIEPRLPPAVHGVRHEGWAAGMRSSLRAGVAALAPGHILLTHVDRPVVAPNTLSRLLTAAGAHPVIPFHRGQPGHPVLLPASLRSRLLEPDDLPLRDVLAQMEVIALQVNDPGVVLNVNTPADYARLSRSRA